MSIERDCFRPDELVHVPDHGDLVVLASGGPLMRVECTEGGKAYCSWNDGGGVKSRNCFPIACLRSLVPYVPAEPLAGDAP